MWNMYAPNDSVFDKLYLVTQMALLMTTIHAKF